MLPRSQHEQIRTWTRQRAQRYRRAVASACLPSSHRRGREPPPMGYCPGIVPRHVVGRGAETNLQVGIGAVPVFNKDRHLTHLLLLHHHRSSAARRIPIPHHSAPCVQTSKEGDGSPSREPIAQGAPDCSTATAVRSSAAQDAALVPCSEASMRARYRKGCGPLRHE